MKELFKTTTEKPINKVKINHKVAAKFMNIKRRRQYSLYQDLYPEKLNKQIKTIKTSIRRRRTKREISNALKIAAIKTNIFKGLVNGENKLQ